MPDETCGDETFPEQNHNSITKLVSNIMSAFNHVKIQEAGGQEEGQELFVPAGSTHAQLFNSLKDFAAAPLNVDFDQVGKIWDTLYSIANDSRNIRSPTQVNPFTVKNVLKS